MTTLKTAPATKSAAAKSFPSAKAAEKAATEAKAATEKAGEIAQSLGLNQAQFKALRDRFAAAAKAGALPGDLLRLVADIVAQAKAGAPNAFAAKLDYYKAQRIRAEMAKPGAVRAEVARKWGVSGQSIKSIVLGHSYARPAGKGATRH